MSDIVRQFNRNGNEAFAEYLLHLADVPGAPPPFELLKDAAATEPVPFTASVDRNPGGRSFENRFAFGAYLVDALSAAQRSSISLNRSIWNWLALYWFDQLCPPAADGTRTPREMAAYYLPEEFKYTRYYRHLVRSPWLAVSLHPQDSKVLLIPVSQRGAPLAVSGEIFEQVAARSTLFRSSPIVSTIYRLYFNPATGRPRLGTAGSAGGSPRRLGQILKQFGLTYDLEWGSDGLVLGLLPREFDAWKGP